MRRWAGSGSGPLLGLLATSALALGCGLSRPPFHLAEDAPRSSDLQRLLLLPVNFDRTPRPALAPGAERVGERIRDYLEQRGYEVVQPRMSTTLALWKECARRAGGIAAEEGREVDDDRYEWARSELVRRILDQLPADGAVTGAVMARQARYGGRRLHWDGVSRLAPIYNESNFPILSLRGKDVGTSLRTTVFDREGRKIFERYVGLEPIHRYVAQQKRIRRVERTDLFQDDALLDDAISLSLQPWLAPPPPGTE